MATSSVGGTAPRFDLPCISGPDAQPCNVTLSDYAGRWLILVFYPHDFTFVCPTELTAFSARVEEFHQRNCAFLGVSVDPIDLHREWLTTSPKEGGLGPLQFPLASDIDGDVARAFGFWVAEKQVATRGLCIIDPNGVLQYVVAHNLSVGRNPNEVLRVLDALQNGGLCPANWTSADGTIDPEDAIKAGTVLGHYRIREEVGVGTFGSVFSAWDLRLERMVALKVLKEKVIASRDAILREARAAAKVSHPHVCTVYAVEEEDGLPIIAMEYLEGRSLAKEIASGLDRDRAVQFARDVAEGLASAHQQEVVHGDLKPANVIVTKEGAAKILDFGLAKSRLSSLAPDGPRDHKPHVADPTEADNDLDATLPGSHATANRSWNFPNAICGTPGYMSPEHALGSPITEASDVYAFGLTFFEMLTGRRAAADRQLVEWVLKLQNDDVAQELASQIDDSLQPLVAAMLARDPGSRPTMRDIAGTLMREMTA